MKRILIAAALALAAGGQALAADLPQPVPPPPRAPATYVPVPAPVFTWTGIYLGINGGYAFGDSNWTSGPSSADLWILDRQLQHQTASSSAVRSAAITSGASSCSASRAMATGRTSTAPPSSPVDLGAAGLRNQERLARHRARPCRLCRSIAILFYGTGGGAFGNVQAASPRCPSAARRRSAGPPAPASNSPSRRT